MRLLPILGAVFLTTAAPALAQVTVDLHALQALPLNPPANRPAHVAPPQVTPTRPSVAAHEAAAMRPAAPPAPQPALPQDVPDTATIAPITPPVVTSAAQPPPPPVSDKAATTAAVTETGLRLAFAPGASDLSPESSASIKRLTESAPPGDSTTFSVLAYAPGKPDDPSTARRISLSRAMAVRSALVADGVPSARIFVRALGSQYGDGPADRADLTVTGASTPSDTAATR